MGLGNHNTNTLLTSEDLASVASDLFPFTLVAPNLDILAFNSHFNQMLGYSEGDLSGRKLSDFILKDQALDLDSRQQKIQLQKKNGQTIWALFHPRKLHPYKEKSDILIFVNEANESIKIEKQAQKIREDIQREYRNQTFLFKQLCYDLESQLKSLEKHLNDPVSFRSENVNTLLKEMTQSLKPMLNLHSEGAGGKSPNQKKSEGTVEDNINVETPLTTHTKSSEKQNNAKILIVDDVEDNIIALGVYFKKLNIPYLSATNGKEALKLIENNDFEIAIVDLHMPEMDGLELAKNIRLWETNKEKQRGPIAAAKDSKRIHLAALTSQESEIERKNCFQAGFDIHFLKPMTKQQLVDYLTDLHFLPLTFDIAI